MRSILATFVLYTVFIGGLSAQQKPKIEAKIIMILDSVSFQSMSITLALRITNLTDEDIYIPEAALRDTSGAYYTIKGDRRSMSYPFWLRHQFVGSRGNAAFAHGSEVFMRSHGKLLSKILNNNAKRSFDIADGYSVKNYGKINKDKDPYYIAPASVYLKKHETVIAHDLLPYTLYSEELGNGEITATVKLENVNSKQFPETILNYKRYIPEDLKIAPFGWDWY